MQVWTIDHKRESMALVLRDNQTNNVHYLTLKGGVGEIEFKVPTNETLLAIVHTHPGDLGSLDYLSVLDANTAATLHVPNYAWSQPTGEILVFTPAVTGPNASPANIRVLSE
jgi:hypothetical protein